jgi:hypothetical protein
VATIFKHQEAEDYFAALDCSRMTSDVAREAVRLYESARVVLLQGLTLDFDADFLGSVEFPGDDKAYKKFKSRTFCAQWRAGTEWPDGIRQRCFAGDRGRLRHFAQQVESVNSQIDRISDALFASYRVLKRSMTWRMSDTVNEDLHVDSYGEELPNHHLRIFVNLDRIPRIWHTSHTLETLLETALPKLDPEFVRTAQPIRICAALNRAVFGGRENAGREQVPKHIAFFEPGEVWLVESRRVSHQIFYGRRALSTEHEIDIASMADPTKHYYAVVEAYRRALHPPR